LVVAAVYVIAFYAMSLALKSLPVSVAYAIWCGLGIVLVAVIYREVPDRTAMLGILLIVVGIVVINTFSRSVVHRGRSRVLERSNSSSATARPSRIFVYVEIASYRR
jgi:drug/metabolite transporter (DMT)-like permease